MWDAEHQTSVAAYCYQASGGGQRLDQRRATSDNEAMAMTEREWLAWGDPAPDAGAAAGQGERPDVRGGVLLGTDFTSYC
jgi:hypothetical protein